VHGCRGGSASGVRLGLRGGQIYMEVVDEMSGELGCMLDDLELLYQIRE